MEKGYLDMEKGGRGWMELWLVTRMVDGQKEDGCCCQRKRQQMT